MANTYYFSSSHLTILGNSIWLYAVVKFPPASNTCTTTSPRTQSLPSLCWIFTFSASNTLSWKNLLKFLSIRATRTRSLSLARDVLLILLISFSKTKEKSDRYLLWVVSYEQAQNWKKILINFFRHFFLIFNQ